MSLTGRSTRGAAREAGASAVEFALLAPLLFLLLFGIVELGMMIRGGTVIANAAREGARHAVVEPDAAKVEDVVRRAARDLDQSALTVDVTCTSAGGGPCAGLAAADPGDAVHVSVRFDHKAVTPMLGLVGRGTMTLSAESIMRVE